MSENKNNEAYKRLDAELKAIDQLLQNIRKLKAEAELYRSDILWCLTLRPVDIAGQSHDLQKLEYPRKKFEEALKPFQEEKS